MVMVDENAQLGGRLPLLKPEALTAPQKKLYELMSARHVPWAQKAGFTAALPDGSFIGPFNPLLLSPEIATQFLELQAAEGEHTVLNERVRQVVILSVGA